MHDIRKAYGWTDNQIIDHAEQYGISGLFEIWKHIREDEAYHYRMLLGLIPLARTPMDKRMANSMRKSEKSIEKFIDDMTPWNQRASRLGALHGKVEEGSVTVILDENDSVSNPLFKDANIQRAKKNGSIKQ